MWGSDGRMRKVVLYIRVSSEDQNLGNQLKVLREYCKNNEMVITEIYMDKISGTKASRPNFNRLLKDMRSRKFKTLVVWKLDRIGRSLQHLIDLIQEMNNKKVDLIVTSQNIDTTTASGKLMFHVIGAFAEFESTLISERTKLGMARAKKDGKIIGRPKKFKEEYPHYCIVNSCRVRVHKTKKLCPRHGELQKLLKERGVVDD